MDLNETITLLPCPFCGGEAQAAAAEAGSSYAWASCSKCHADGPLKPTNLEADAAWNDRVAKCTPCGRPTAESELTPEEGGGQWCRACIAEWEKENGVRWADGSPITPTPKAGWLMTNIHTGTVREIIRVEPNGDCVALDGGASLRYDETLIRENWVLTEKPPTNYVEKD